VDQDDPLLLAAICAEVLPPKGIQVDTDQVLITNGAQQALSLLSTVLLDSGRVVAMGDPGYIDAARIFQRAGARLHLVPVDERGIRPDLEADVDLVYVTPSHHHPTNVTLHHRRRQALLTAAAERDFLVIEDDYDSEVRFQGAPTPPIKSLDRDGRVIYIGTFSKFLAPGLRLGYVVADPELIAELRDQRRYSTKHPSGHLQRSLALFINSGDFHRALRQHRVLLKRKWQTLDTALREHLPWPPAVTSAGGLSFWITGPADFDATAMALRAREMGVLVSPGEGYYLRTNPPRNSFRLGLNAVPQVRIVPGVQLLARAIQSRPAVHREDYPEGPHRGR
jgi:GntR family transcriptional regulator/MocR family aminotransferase